MTTITDIQTALALKMQVEELTEQITSLRKWLSVLTHKDAALSVSFKLSGVEAVREIKQEWQNIDSYKACSERFAVQMKRGGTIYLVPEEGAQDEMIMHKFSEGGSIRLLNFLLNEKLLQRDDIMRKLEQYVSNKNFVQYERNNNNTEERDGND